LVAKKPLFFCSNIDVYSSNVSFFFIGFQPLLYQATSISKALFDIQFAWSLFENRRLMASTCCYYSWFLMLVLMFFVSLFSPAWSATVSKRQQQHPEGVKQGPITSLAAVTDEELRRDLATIFCNQSCDEGYQPFR
jgi:hypothetical protein